MMTLTLAITLRDSIQTRERDFPAGLALGGRGLSYVATNNASGDGDPAGAIG